MALRYEAGYKVIGTIKAIKGDCSFGHKVGDKFELTAHKNDGLCGFFYHSIFPFIVMLQFGGKFPKKWNGEWEITFDCPDTKNAATIALRLGESMEGEI